METVTTLARLSRFVIADITDPRSVIGELEAAVKALPSVIFLPVLQESHKPWGMFGDLADYDWVLPPVKYSDAQDVSNSVAGWIELVKNHAQKLDRKRRSRRKAFTV